MKQHDMILSTLSALGIEQLNEMQETMLHTTQTHKDILLLSPTGSGKTIAFLLPVLMELKQEGHTPQALILVPSRELALQVDEVFRQMKSGWRSCCCYGGHAIAEEKRTITTTNPAVIIGTPGRIADHLRKGNFSPELIHTLVIDEFDKSLELGFHEEMEEILIQLPNLKKRLLTSATDIEELPAFVSEGAWRKIRLIGDQNMPSRLQLFKVLSPEKDKIDTLFRLLCTLGSSSCIVFCNYREAVERVGKLLTERGFYSEIFHGGMEQPDREKALYKFRNKSCYALISTDLAARGLDIPEIEHIIHYHLPVNEEAFVHRNGRTARWEATGTSFLILNPEEQLPEYISDDIKEFALPAQPPKPANPEWTTLYIGKGKKDKVSRMDIVGFLCKKGKLNGDDIGKIDVKEHYGFATVKRSKVKQLLKLIQNEKIKGVKTRIEEAK